MKKPDAQKPDSIPSAGRLASLVTSLRQIGRHQSSAKSKMDDVNTDLGSPLSKRELLEIQSKQEEIAKTQEYSRIKIESIMKDPAYLWLKAQAEKNEKLPVNALKLEKLNILNEFIEDSSVFEYTEISMEKFLDQAAKEDIIDTMISVIQTVNTALQRGDQITDQLNSDTKIGEAGENLPQFIKTIDENYRGSGPDLDEFLNKIGLILQYINNALNQENIALSGYKLILMPILANAQRLRDAQNELSDVEDSIIKVKKRKSEIDGQIKDKEKEVADAGKRQSQIEEKISDANKELQKIAKQKEDAIKLTADAKEELITLNSKVEAQRIIINDLIKFKTNLETGIVNTPSKPKEKDVTVVENTPINEPKKSEPEISVNVTCWNCKHNWDVKGKKSIEEGVAQCPKCKKDNKLPKIGKGK